MKFCKLLERAKNTSTLLCMEEQWLDYKLLKKTVNEIRDLQNESTFYSNGLLDIKNPGERKFFLMLHKELFRVSNTFNELQSRLLQNLKKHNQLMSSLNTSYINTYPYQEAKPLLDSDTQNCIDLHLQFVLLESYAFLNYTGFRKILKKHDKMTGFQTKDKYMSKLVNDSSLAQQELIAQILTQLEADFNTLMQHVEKN